MRTVVDKRVIDARPIPGAAGTLRGLAAEYREIQLRLARFLAEVQDARHFSLEGCASIEEWGARFGLARAQVRGLRDIGRSLRANPPLEKALRSASTDIERAATVSRVLSHPEMVRPRDRWIEQACSETLPQLRSRVRQRIEEFAQRTEDVVSFQAYVRPETKAEFERARILASRKERTALTNGQVLHRITHAYLEAHDPSRRASGTRRVPHTSTRPRDRYIPSEVRRAIESRSGGRCEFPGCEHDVFLEHAHIRPHARGSAREVEDFLLLCSNHHKLFDAGVVRLVGGTVEDPTFWIKGVGTVSAAKPGPVPGEGPPRPSSEDSGKHAPGRDSRRHPPDRIGEREHPYRESSGLELPLFRARSRF